MPASSIWDIDRLGGEIWRLHPQTDARGFQGLEVELNFLLVRPVSFLETGNGERGRPAGGSL